MACHSQRRAAGGGRTLMAAGGEEGTVATWPKVMAPPRCVWHSSHAHFGPTCKRLWQSRRHPPVMRPTSIESRNTDLTGIVLNSYALGAFMLPFKIQHSSAFTLHGTATRGSDVRGRRSPHPGAPIRVQCARCQLRGALGGCHRAGGTPHWGTADSVFRSAMNRRRPPRDPGPRRYTDSTPFRSAVAHNHIIEKHTAATPTAAPP